MVTDQFYTTEHRWPHAPMTHQYLHQPTSSYGSLLSAPTWPRKEIGQPSKRNMKINITNKISSKP